MSQNEWVALGRAVSRIERAVRVVAPSMDEGDAHNTGVGVVADVTGMLPSTVEEAYLVYRDFLSRAHLPSWWPKDSTEGGQQ